MPSYSSWLVGVDNHKKDGNYCNSCNKKLHNKEKAKSVDAGLLWPVCIDCAYVITHKYISEHGYAKAIV